MIVYHRKCIASYLSQFASYFMVTAPVSDPVSGPGRVAERASLCDSYSGPTLHSTVHSQYKCSPHFVNGLKIS